MKFKVLQALELLPDNTYFVIVDKMQFSLFFTLMKNRKKRFTILPEFNGGRMVMLWRWPV